MGLYPIRRLTPGQLLGTPYNMGLLSRFGPILYGSYMSDIQRGAGLKPKHHKGTTRYIVKPYTNDN